MAEFDVFLSYNTKDKQQVEKIEEWLESQQPRNQKLILL